MDRAGKHFEAIAQQLHTGVEAELCVCQKHSFPLQVDVIPVRSFYKPWYGSGYGHKGCFLKVSFGALQLLMEVDVASSITWSVDVRHIREDQSTPKHTHIEEMSH